MEQRAKQNTEIMDKKMILRPYQNQAVDAAIKYLKEVDGSPLISAATGTGKSVIIASIIKRLMIPRPDINVMIVTHSQELIQQNHDKLKAIWPEAPTGIYSSGLGRKELVQITFGGIQSLWRINNIPVVNLLIIDEAHTISRKQKSMWGRFIGLLKAVNPKIKIIGLSATTFRLDSGNLTTGDDAMFTDICFDYGLKKAIDDGWLAPLTAKYTKTKYDISGVHKIAGEFNLKELQEATNKESLNSEAVAEIIAAGKNRKTWLTFCNGVDHSFAVRDEFRRQGIEAETITGETPDNLRAEILARLKAGKLRCVTNNAVLTTGVDVPNIDLIAMMRHTLSGGLLIQMAGRGTRPIIDLNPYNDSKERREAIKNSHKPNCLFMDFARNIDRHGFLDEITGKDKDKKDGVAPMKECPICFSICHAAAKHCPDCGHEFPIEKKQINSEVYKGAVISGAEKKEVIGVSYYPHNLNKEGKTPCLMVVYKHPDLTTTKEYICLQHEGFAQHKALKWWYERRGQSGVENLGIKMIVDAGYCDNLLQPKSIIVRREGKFDRVINHIGLGEPTIPIYDSNTLADMEEISF